MVTISFFFFPASYAGCPIRHFLFCIRHIWRIGNAAPLRPFCPNWIWTSALPRFFFALQALSKRRAFFVSFLQLYVGISIKTKLFRRFPPENLHISKKSSIFALDFKSVLFPVWSNRLWPYIPMSYNIPLHPATASPCNRLDLKSGFYKT